VAAAAAALLATLSGCARDTTTIDLQVAFRKSGEGQARAYRVVCSEKNRASRECEALVDREEMLLPAAEGFCSLPSGSSFVAVRGTIDGRSVKRTITPCGKNGNGAIALWRDLLAERR
jgi:hypothetical protein